MAESSNSGNESAGVADGEPVPVAIKHDFGFQVSVPLVWFVDYLPKASMRAGQVSYTTPGGNVFFTSFGELGEVAKRFRTLNEFRNASIGRMRTQSKMTGNLEVSEELSICGHRAILSSFQGKTPVGASAEIWSVDLWCDVMNRYFSLFGDNSQRGEFRDFRSVFTSFAKSLVCHERPSGPQRPAWEWADLGFNTKSKLWFLDLFNFAGLTETYHTFGIIVSRGSAIQYQWPQKGGKAMWHVRERYSSRDVSSIGYDSSGALIVERSPETKTIEIVPEVFDSIAYAYSLRTSRGFIEFRDASDMVVKKIEDRWIAVENLTHKTAGAYPNIRLTARREDIERIIVTDSCIVIEGRRAPQVS